MNYKLILIAVMVFTGIAVAPSQSVSAEYLGEFCWVGTAPGSQTSVTVKLGIFHEGGSHFSVRGHVVNTQGRIQPVFGTIELIAGEIFMSAMTTDDGDYTLGYIKLDPRTFDMTASNLRFHSDPGSDPEMETESLTLTLTACP